MKRKLNILLAVLLLAGLTATAQIQRGSKKQETKPTTEQPKKKEGTTSKSNKGGSKKNNQQSAAERQRLAEEQRRQQEEAERKRIIQQAIDDMVYVEGGTFMMGATAEQGSDADDDEKPAHQVTLSSYYIGKYEVTQELWLAVMGKNPSYFVGGGRPVEMVSWDDCQEFLRKLNQMTGKNFRLPTEAEWEFAARGGNQSRGYKYSGSDNLGSVAWYWNNSDIMTYLVGEKSPNELGLYDMSGNVWEWCQDWFGSYSSESQTNPTGPTTGNRRVIRGGSWNIVSATCFRVSIRGRNTPSYQDYSIGLRLAL